MADAQALRDLAQEVEGLSKEGSFDVECRVLTTLYPQVEVMHGIALWTEGARGGTRIRIDSYTRSIDAAAKLMPPHWRLAGLQEQPVDIGGWHATGLRIPPGAALVAGDAKTEPLARTACALRAIAADLEAKTDV